MKKESNEELNEKSIIIEINENESGLQIHYGTKGFTPFEVIGILQMQINKIIEGITEKSESYSSALTNNRTQA